MNTDFTAMANALRKLEPSADKTDFKVTPPSNDDLIGISEMARLFDTTYRTLRFYESKGLLKTHRDGVNRLYDDESKRQFRLILEGRQLGFTLSEIAKLLASSMSKDELQMSLDMIADQISHLEEQRKQIDEALVTLRKRHYLMNDPGDDAEG